MSSLEVLIVARFEEQQRPHPCPGCTFPPPALATRQCNLTNPC